ncbi:MAG: hypothetical protein L7U87_00080 [Chlamydiales bacterium]|nr:hypothetical protein [Chlamydiales bacterium]
MIPEDFCITVISLPDRERLVAEIFYKDEQWAEISQETPELSIQIYPSLNSEYWEFNLNEAMKVLNYAKEKLLGG